MYYNVEDWNFKKKKQNSSAASVSTYFNLNLRKLKRGQGEKLSYSEKNTFILNYFNFKSFFKLSKIRGFGRNLALALWNWINSFNFKSFLQLSKIRGFGRNLAL